MFSVRSSQIPLASKVIIAAVVVAGCGGGTGGSTAASSPSNSSTPPATTAPNGVEQLSATEILDKAKAAAVAAGSVHVSGEVVQDEETFGIDMRFGADGSTGTMTFNGAELELLRVGQDVYMKATGDMWENLTGQQGVGELIGDRYVKVPSGDQSFGDFTSFLSLESFIDGVLDPTGELEKGQTTEVRGAQAIGVVNTDKKNGGTVYVALTGEPLPLRIEGAEAAEGAIDFLDWGEAVEVTAPAEGDVVDLSELMN